MPTPPLGVWLRGAGGEARIHRRDNNQIRDTNAISCAVAKLSICGVLGKTNSPPLRP
jgi:hypothetical protein